MAELRRAVRRMLGKKHETANAEDDILFPALAREKTASGASGQYSGPEMRTFHQFG